MATDPEFEVLAELADYAIMRVSYGEKPYVYTAKRTSNDRWMTKPIPEGYFWELMMMVEEEEDIHKGDLGKKR